MAKLIGALILSIPLIPLSGIRIVISLLILTLIVIGLIQGRLSYFDSILVVVSLELTLKITGSLIISEFIKYSCLLLSLLFTLRQVEKTRVALTLVVVAFLFLSLDIDDDIKAQLQFIIPWVVILIFFQSSDKINRELAKIVFRFSTIALIMSVLIYAGDFNGFGSGQWSNNAAVGFSANQFTNYAGAWFLAFLIFNDGNKVKYIDLLLMLGLLIIGLLSLSRGGIVSFFIAAGLLRSRRKFLSSFFLITVASLIVFWTLPADLRTALELRYTGRSENSTLVVNDLTSGRQSLNARDLEVFYNNPILGIGINNTRTVDRNVSSHSEWIRLLAEHGIVGTLPLLLMLLWLIGGRFNRLNKRLFWSATAFIIFSFHQGSNRNIAQVLPMIVVLSRQYDSTESSKNRFHFGASS